MFPRDEKLPKVRVTMVDIEAAQSTSPKQDINKPNASLRVSQVIALVLFAFCLTVIGTLSIAPSTRSGLIHNVEISSTKGSFQSLFKFDKRDPIKLQKIPTISTLRKPRPTPTVQSAIATGGVTRNIIFPLYIDPGAKGIQWAPIVKAANAYRSVTFTIIINPNSGPGLGKARTAPDPEYLAGLANLANVPNIQVIGYVHQSYGARPYANVMADVAVWASWGTASMYGIQISGIFFDEGPSDSSSTSINYVKKVNSATKGMPGFAGVPFVVQNPGTLAPAAYYTDAMNCDISIILEDTYATYRSAASSFNGQATKLGTGIDAFSFIFTSMPSMTLAQLKVALTPMVQQVGYIFLTNLSGDNMYSAIGSDWALFVQAMASI